MAFGIPGIISKHRRVDEDGNRLPGRCRIGVQSGLRKLMRAARRGIVPPDQAHIIGQAMQNAAAYRPERWLSSHQRRALAS